MLSEATEERQSQKHKGLILEIQKLSTDDGPGIRTSVFFKGCPLKCKWCHNPESIPRKQGIQWFKVKCISCGTCVEVCKEGAIKQDRNGIYINRDKCSICGTCVDECPSTALKIFGKEWSIKELYHEIAKDKEYYKKSNGGVTVSGGEPLLQSEFVLAFLKKCKRNNIHTALDTCGYTVKQNLEKLLPYVDLFLYDLKEIDPKKHTKFTSVSNEIILENCKWLVSKVKDFKKKIWIRTPIIPGYTASEKNIRGIAKFITNQLNDEIERWDLLAFNNLCKDKYERMDWKWELDNEQLLTREEMEKFHSIAIDEGVQNPQWSGLTKNK